MSWHDDRESDELTCAICGERATRVKSIGKFGPVMVPLCNLTPCNEAAVMRYGSRRAPDGQLDILKAPSQGSRS